MLVAQSCPTLCEPWTVKNPTRVPGPWDFPGKITGVGCHFLLHVYHFHIFTKYKIISGAILSQGPSVYWLLPLTFNIVPEGISNAKSQERKTKGI